MRSRTALVFSFAVSLAALGQEPSPAPAKPLTQDELLRQIETLSPAATDPGRRTPAVMPVPGSPARASRTEAAAASNIPTAAGLFPDSLPGAKAEKPEKKSKGPTEIVAQEATFDQKTHIAVFIGDVVVTDPEFNVQCDKLTANLKHKDETQVAAAPTRLQAAAPEPKADEKKQDKGGGLEKALAEANQGGVVTVMQVKQEADGSISRSIGHGKKALYDASTGDITLYGHPDVQQGINTCVAAEESTIMVLNRDGHMRVTGAHKTVIRDQNELTK